MVGRSDLRDRRRFSARKIQARYVDNREHKPLIYFLSGDDMHKNREELAEISYEAYFTTLTLEGEIKAILAALDKLTKPVRLQISRNSQLEMQDNQDSSPLYPKPQTKKVIRS